jgi:hypothetical protein
MRWKVLALCAQDHAGKWWRDALGTTLGGGIDVVEWKYRVMGDIVQTPANTPAKRPGAEVSA